MRPLHLRDHERAHIRDIRRQGRTWVLKSGPWSCNSADDRAFYAVLARECYAEASRYLRALRSYGGGR